MMLKMKVAAAILVPFFVAAAYGQAPPPDTAQNLPATEQTKTSEGSQNGDAQRSTIEVKPGAPVIKQKDIWDETGYLHPFTRMPRYILQDPVKAIWTSPFHTAKKDVKLMGDFRNRHWRSFNRYGSSLGEGFAELVQPIVRKYLGDLASGPHTHSYR